MVVAICRDGEARLIKNPEGSEITPSFIAFLPSGETAVGRKARSRRIIDPPNSLYSVKRIFGAKWGSAVVNKFAKNYPLELEQGPNDQPLFVTRAGKLSPDEVVERMLKHLRANPLLERENIDRVAFTVPVAFHAEQRSALIAVAARAGFGNVEVIDEPHAAALAFQRQSAKERFVVVYDLGGGTFDVTVLRWAASNTSSDYEILGVDGDAYLGGDDVDRRCANWIAEEILKQYHWDVRTSTASYQRLLFMCEHAKILLSMTQQQKIDLSPIDEVLRGKSFTISRDDIERIASDLIQQTFVVCDGLLRKAGVGPNKVDNIFLSGGGSLMPMIQKGVAMYFGQQPETNPTANSVVAIGAALHAGRSGR